ncbi:methyltransferase [Gulosibacter sp. 10]|uniref:methyltransferase n=1 Tax=Gulosibacter sp. 10 TaxID=1255570 RepID=UPI00097F4E3F|nr:methyltransferase [Gulosibacter sp. 10]SJM66017.1 hypothetical protein FM112_11410 [Gulosibacter sp. 10]
MAESVETADGADEVRRLRGELRAARLEASELRRSLDELERRHAAQKAASEHFAKQLKELRNSRSWQVTAPLRRAMRNGRG